MSQNEQELSEKAWEWWQSIEEGLQKEIILAAYKAHVDINDE